MNKAKAEVTKIQGPSYGSVSDIKISLHTETGPVKYFLGYDKKYGHWHWDNSGINILGNQFSNYIPTIGDPYYEGYVVDWGYDVEVGLCLLMREGKLNLPLRYRNELYDVKLNWIGEPWNPEVHRKIKRRFKKNPKLIWI